VIKKAQENENVRRAEDILRGRVASVDEMFQLAKTLKGDQEFGYARRLFGRARSDAASNVEPLRTRLRQQHALCTYKDPDLAAELRFQRAITILGEAGDLPTTVDQETLGIAGAIYKYRWEAFAQRRDLEVSLHYYYRGWKQGIERDLGYTGINAAYILDLLADLEIAGARQAGAESPSAARRIEEAHSIRAEIADTLAEYYDDPAHPENKSNWWLIVTGAEACFGLERFEEAETWLKRTESLPELKEWEFETTVRQMASLSRVMMRRAGKEDQMQNSPAWKILERFLKERAPGIWSIFIGKIGLALSGGGFRASLYHIGVLAKLAELDVLRHVEVISCVSGGSIVGAAYYLKVQKLLQSKPSEEITRDSYVELVRDLERDFLEGVQTNIRTRVIGDLPSNLKMAFFSDYSRTTRVGELYETNLYQQGKPDPKPLFMHDLIIWPYGESTGFKPKHHNWRRKDKVPMLVLNATTLNSCHNWQFTASWMGEPPSGTAASVDSNYRLRRMYYAEAPPEFRSMRLGQAVAASACVPGLFDPLNLNNLYPGITVRLVDGGVHDNQGTTALLDQGCTLLLVSDASGQMGDQNDPKSDFIRVPLRSNSILQARIRGAQYQDLQARMRSSLLRGLMFVHLKSGLEPEVVDWTGCEDPVEASDDAQPIYERGELTPYGIRKEVQKKLAAVRTDLDSFNEVEAFALMTSGYMMTEWAFPRAVPQFPAAKGDKPDWRFLQIQNLMTRRTGQEEKYETMLGLLDVAQSGGFKIWKLIPALTFTAWILGFLSAALVFYILYRMGVAPVITYRTVFLALAGLVGSYLAAKIATRLLGPSIPNLLKGWITPRRIRNSVEDIIFRVALAIVGFILAWTHLLLFDPWYLSQGKMSRLK
jgi:predicted acylesterase/phospholipase RssA